MRTRGEKRKRVGDERRGQGKRLTDEEDKWLEGGHGSMRREHVVDEKEGERKG